MSEGITLGQRTLVLRAFVRAPCRPPTAQRRVVFVGELGRCAGVGDLREAANERRRKVCRQQRLWRAQPQSTRVVDVLREPRGVLARLVVLASLGVGEEEDNAPVTRAARPAESLHEAHGRRHVVDRDDQVDLQGSQWAW